MPHVHSSCRMPHAHSSCRVLSVPCPIPRVACCMPGVTCCMPFILHPLVHFVMFSPFGFESFPKCAVCGFASGGKVGTSSSFCLMGRGPVHFGGFSTVHFGAFLQRGGENGPECTTVWRKRSGMHGRRGSNRSLRGGRFPPGWMFPARLDVFRWARCFLPGWMFPFILGYAGEGGRVRVRSGAFRATFCFRRARRRCRVPSGESARKGRLLSLAAKHLWHAIR